MLQKKLPLGKKTNKKKTPYQLVNVVVQMGIGLQMRKIRGRQITSKSII